MRILIAAGGSEHSALAVRVGAEVARATKSQATLLHVIKKEGKRPKGEQILGEAESMMGQTGAAIVQRIRLGHPAEEILAEGREGLYDLIVVGTWPKHQLISRLLAPATERVINLAPCPILVAKAEVNSLNHILLCASGIDKPSRPARFAARLVEQMDRETDVTVLHVMSQYSAGPGAGDGWPLQAEASELLTLNTTEGELLRQDIRLFTRAQTRTQALVRHGLVVDEILAEAQSGLYDLIVIGAFREVGWQRFLMDDLSHQILTRVDRSIVVV